MMKIGGAHWHCLQAAVCLGSLAVAAASEACSEVKGELSQDGEGSKAEGAVELLQTGRSHSFEGRRASVPGFLPDLVIDLDLPPRDRFRGWARWMASNFGPDDPRMPVSEDGVRRDPRKSWLDGVMSAQEQQEWAQVLKGSIGAEYLEELVGIEEEYAIAMQAYGRPLPFATAVDEMLLYGVLYELAYPDVACSGVLVALPNGTVIHGRNMDYYIMGFTDNSNITQKVTFMRGGQPLYTTITRDTPMTVATALRFGGWSIEINTHESNNRLVNLATGMAGGKASGWTLRRFMDTVPDFETALLSIRQTTWMAPQYLVLAGAGPGQGAVLTLHRAELQESWAEPGYPHPMVMERRLSPESGVWYMAQTNDEAWGAPADWRRPFEQAWLEFRGRGHVTAEDIMRLIRTPPARQSDTLYSFVMVPATNYSDLVISKHVTLA